jgi:hypothetical protein
MTAEYRAAAPADETLKRLGHLAELPGTWVGRGFNLISLPDQMDRHANTPFRLKFNATRETLSFSLIGAPIPNRGSLQDDIEFLGLRYLQEVSDASSHEALHVEVGLWLNVPSPAGPASVVRQATIPHGASLLAQGRSSVEDGGPRIDPVSSTPFRTMPSGKQLLSETGNDNDKGYLLQFTATVPPSGVPPEAVQNPNVVLTEAIKEQKIVSTVKLAISSAPDGGIVNIPFLQKNANATSFEAIFWIETVEHPLGYHSLQLQYTQTVILNFQEIDWPHISVATLVKH